MNEAIIIIGVPFFLVYLSTTYENKWLKLLIKMFAVILVTVASSIVLTAVDLAPKDTMYDLFAVIMLWFFRLFMFIWFTVLIYELFMFFVEKRKKEMEGTQ